MPVRRVRDIDAEEETTAAEREESLTEEEDRPRRTRRSTRAVEKEEEPPFVEDDEDARPAASSAVQKGWKKAKEVAKSTSSEGDWINDFRWTEEAQLVKFLSSEPMSYKQHWVERQGKRGFVCLDRDCPLCDVGVKATPKHAFSILVLDDNPKVYLLVVGNRDLGQLADLDSNPKVGPLTRPYWSLSKSGTGPQTVHSFVPVKERDLEEDWDISPEEALEFVDSVEPADESAIVVTSYADLKAIASALS